MSAVKRARSMTRFVIVMIAMMAAILGLAMAIGDAHPLMALGLTVAICIISSAVLPSAPWVRFTDGIRQIAQALGWRGWKPPWAAVVSTLALGLYLAVDMPLFERSIPDGLICLAVIVTASILAIWRPGRDTIRQWRDERLEERRLSRQLTQMDAHDSEDFSGRGIPRKDWARFNDELAGVLHEMRSKERES